MQNEFKYLNDERFSKMTNRMKQFCHEFLIDLNGTKAAERAGYSLKTATEMASENLTKPIINDYLNALREELIKKSKFSPEWVLNKLGKVAARCLQEEPVLDKMGNETGIFKFDSSGANKSLELIGKTTGMFTEKIDHTSNGEPLKPTIIIGTPKE